MSLYVVLILAIVQSLTEFLPISSTAHLALSRWLFGWGPTAGVSDLTFDIALHLGTLTATVAYFFRDWLQLAAQAAPSPAGWRAESDQNQPLLVGLEPDAPTPQSQLILALADLWQVIGPLRHARLAR